MLSRSLIRALAAVAGGRVPHGSQVRALERRGLVYREAGELQPTRAAVWYMAGFRDGAGRAYDEIKGGAP